MSSQSNAALVAGRFLLLLLLLTIPVWAPLMRPGLPASEVGPLPVLKLHTAEQGNTSTILQPDRWRSDGSWPYLVARLPRALGADGTTAMKFSVGLAVLVLALGMYGWGKELAGPRAGVLAAVLALYTPVFLSTLYRAGDWAAVWTAAGLALAGCGLATEKRWGLALAGLGAFIAMTSAPGLGLWAVIALVAFAVGTRNWLGLGAVAVGAILGLLLAAPWFQPYLPDPPTLGVLLHQLIEPAWLWSQQTLTWGVPLSFSLGLALLGLLFIAIWAYPWEGKTQNAKIKSGDDRSSIFNLQSSTLIILLTIGLILALFSLDFIASRFSLVSTTLAAPWHLLLLAVPFLAVVAASTLRLIPDLQRAPIWAALLIIGVLSAGPALSPDFTTYKIPAAPAAIYGDNQIMLLQLEMDGDLESGETITLDATWMALQPPNFDYNIFAHIVDDTGTTIAQLDTQPQDGARPLTSWFTGQPIPDQYTLDIPANAPADLQLRLGLYNWQTQERLSVGDTDALELP